MIVDSENPSEIKKNTGIIINNDYEDNYEDESAEDIEARREMELLYEDSLGKFKEGEIVKGRIIKIDRDYVLVDIGFKSEGIIPLSEFPENGTCLEEGEEIEVYLEQTENNDGMVVLSKEKANKIKVWEQIVNAYNNNDVMEGEVTSKIKGGLTMDIGLKAFLPGSQIDLKPVRNLEKLIGQKFKVKVIKINKKAGNIVLSRRIILEEERKDARKDLLANLEEGGMVEGIVKNITDYGAFIDLGGVDGLLHITDMSWGRVNHPSELFTIGEKIKIIVLKYDKKNERVSLGFKQITPDPWGNIEEKYEVGTIVRGKVVNIAAYGAFVEIEKGIEGLIHVSELSWNKHVTHPSKLLAIGDIVEAMILSLDKEKKRISLGMKQTEANPWITVEERYPVGSVVEGVVRSITNFGAFVELEEGIDGLIHITDMSWSSKIKHPSEIVKKRERIKVSVLNIDKDEERLSLGIKQLTPDPWDSLNNKYNPGDIVKGVVVKLTNFGAFVEVEEGIEGLIHVSQISSEKIAKPEDKLTIGDKVSVKIIKVDVNTRKMGLSIKAYEEGIDINEIDTNEIDGFSESENRKNQENEEETLN